MFPRRVNVSIPRPDLSAREAVQLVESEIVGLGTAWVPVWIAAAGGVGFNGRLFSSHAAWQFLFVNAKDPDVISMMIFGTGRLSIAKSQSGVPALPAIDLSGNWLDSTTACELAGMDDVSLEYEFDSSQHMKLYVANGIGMFWEIRRTSLGKPTDSRIQFSQVLDAYSGMVVGGTLARSIDGEFVVFRRRMQGFGNLWQDVRVEGRIN